MVAIVLRMKGSSFGATSFIGSIFVPFNLKTPNKIEPLPQNTNGYIGGLDLSLCRASMLRDKLLQKTGANAFRCFQKGRYGGANGRSHVFLVFSRE